MVHLRLRASAVAAALMAVAASVACTSETIVVEGAPAAACSDDAQCNEGAPLCDGATKTCSADPPAKEIGYRDGTASSVGLTALVTFGDAMKPVDLAFHPTRTDELWVIGYGDNAVEVGTGISTSTPKWKRYIDPANSHFMYKPTAIAMGAGETFGTCGDNDDGHNRGGTPSYFMGPALFSTDLTVFATFPTNLGSHLDMLHSTPFCRGVAHVEANWFWAFNAYDGALDKYNFAKDHGPGNDDHSDGEIYRYALGQVKGSDGTPSHLFYDKDDKFLYVADTGNARVVRLDTTKGTKTGEALPRANEPLAGSSFVTGVDVEEIVAPGTLKKPSGLEVRGGLIYVTDAETSTFHVFSKDGKEVRKLATDLPAGSLAGFTFDSAGRLLFTDAVGGRVVRIDPR